VQTTLEVDERQTVNIRAALVLPQEWHQEPGLLLFVLVKHGFAETAREVEVCHHALHAHLAGESLSVRRRSQLQLLDAQQADVEHAGVTRQTRVEQDAEHRNNCHWSGVQTFYEAALPADSNDELCRLPHFRH
jgi:hypothetical protein